MDACFGLAISNDRIERNHRFLEESLELVQANGCTQSEAHQLVDYVFNRPQGEIHQEIGGVMVTLAALCLALGRDMHKCGEIELERIWGKVETIRAKQAAKPKHSPLPMAHDLVAEACHGEIIAALKQKINAWSVIMQDVVAIATANPASLAAFNSPILQLIVLELFIHNRGIDPKDMTDDDAVQLAIWQEAVQRQKHPLLIAP